MRYKLGEVAKIRYGKDHKKLDDGNIPVYGSGGIMRYVDTVLYDKKSVLIPRKGSLGNLFFANKPFWTVDTLFYTEIDENILMPEFLFYKLKMFNLASMNVGSAVPSLTTAILNALELDIPSFEVQSQIVNILNAFDERISLNKQINHHLAELIDAQFAHLLEDNELYKSTFSEIGEIVGGGTPSKKVDDYWNGDIPWLSPKDLSLNPAMFTGRGQNSITELGYKKSSAKLMPRNSILFSSRAPIGYITIAENDISTNQGFKSIIPKPEYPYTFVYELLKQETPSLESSASGSTFKEVSGTHLKNHEIRIPSHSAIIKFHESVKPLFKTINLNEKEIQKLIEVRDLLLPTLMSGEISVSD
ncbi:TPA: restriction endonuclease subunit S [Streptococcus suis]|uniref:restriction endonuclease subunit S n=1 Tax=Streptococcus uberis TaxID=1349 RepID=UPI002B0FE773|nr:restriction endonuclease subunit S [Streptococcus suis]